MYIKTLYNAHKEYCKEYWLNHVGYESFTERWRHFLDKWTNPIIEANNGLWGNRVIWESIKESYAKYINETGIDIWYWTYRTEILNYEPIEKYNKLYKIHTTLNGKYSIYRSKFDRRLNRWVDLFSVVFFPNLHKQWTWDYTNRIDKLLYKNKLSLVDYCELRKVL